MKKTRLVENRWVSRTLLATVLLALFALAFAVSPQPAAAQTTLPCFTTHVVQPGQYIAQIGRIYGVTPQAIIAANPQVTNPNIIYPGQTLNIPLCGAPVPPPPPPPPTVPPGGGTGGIPGACRWWHYVSPGETMLSISRFYGVDPFVIARANNIFNLNLIYAGSTLCIP